MTTGHDNVLAAIKEAVDIVQLIGEYIHVEPAGAKHRALCPFHDDKKPSLQIDPEFRNYRCWACGAKGDVFTFLQQYEKISFVEAKERLAKRAGIAVARGSSGRGDFKARLVSVLEWAAKLYQKSLLESPQGRPARQYLLERGVAEETIRRYGLGFAPAEFEWLIRQAATAGIDAATLARAGLAKVSRRQTHYDVFRGRIVFPIRDVQGRTVGFGGRIVPSLDDGRGPKYLNSPATDVYNKSQVLYGLDVAAQAFKSARAAGPGERLPLVVMEGYMDCLAAYQAGLLTAVAACGTALTADHVQRLRGYADCIVLMFDGDPAGRKAADDAVALFLGSEVDIRLCMLPDGLDPCDFVVQRGVDELRRRIAEAPDALDYAIRRARAVYDSSGLDGRSRALADVLETMAAMPLILRGAMQQRLDLAVNRLAEAFRVEEAALRRRLAELRRDKTPGERRTSPAQPSGPAGPLMPPRERTIAELAVVHPGRIGELAPLAEVEAFTHAGLRRIVETCIRLCGRMGEAATTESLREELGDAALDALVAELWESAPKGDKHAAALAEAVRALAEDRRRKRAAGLFRLGPDAGGEEHLAALRALASPSAANP
jgi:DNA primase